MGRGEEPNGLLGVAYRHPETGEVIASEVAQIPGPNDLPDFPYHRLDVERYVRHAFMGRTLPHHSSYGCPFFVISVQW